MKTAFIIVSSNNDINNIFKDKLKKLSEKPEGFFEELTNKTYIYGKNGQIEI